MSIRKSIKDYFWPEYEGNEEEELENIKRQLRKNGNPCSFISVSRKYPKGSGLIQIAINEVMDELYNRLFVSSTVEMDEKVKL